jgi:hypothetical protein
MGGILGARHSAEQASIQSRDRTFDVIVFDEMRRLALWALLGSLALVALLFALTLPAFDPVSDVSRATLRLGVYCRSLNVGDAWSPQHAEREKIHSALEIDGGVQTYLLTNGGVSRCDVVYDPATGKIRSLLYHAD